MTDRRELLLSRLLEIASGTEGIVAAFRNKDILLGAKPEALGTAINILRARFVKAVLGDAELSSIVGTNGEIRYEGCATALARGRSMEGEMGVSFSFTYVLQPEEL